MRVRSTNPILVTFSYLAFNRQQNYPLPNLFVSMLQRFGIETDRFASATGTMTGLELKST